MKNTARILGMILFVSAIMASCNTTKTDPLTALASGRWMLDSFESKKVDSTNFGNGMPYLEFNKEEMRVSGFSGCNRLMGGFSLVEENGISLDKLASTKMACMGVNKESEFLAALDKADHFKVKDELLQLLSGKTELMTFTATKGE
ncbi:META domain-containing protein [Sinomicrobium sp. M5D2P17]